VNSDLDRGRREDSKYVKIFKFGEVLELWCGGAAVGHRTGNFSGRLPHSSGELFFS
jgi:hypothetical protein